MKQTLKAAAVIGILAAAAIFWIALVVVMCITDAENIAL